MFRTAILIAGIAVSIVCLAILCSMPMPARIETAGSQADLDRRVAEVDPRGVRLGFALGFDYLFMAAYVTAIGLGCAMAAERAHGLWQPAGRILAYAQIASGLVDALENATC